MHMYCGKPARLVNGSAAEKFAARPGPNNEDIYAYDWLDCKLKNDAAACERVTSCNEPGISAAKCNYSQPPSPGFRR